MLMQFFNEINSRKLGAKDFNVFKNFFNNLYFLSILAGQFALQYLILTYGGSIFRTTPLTAYQHLIALSFGVGSLLISVLLKTTKESWLRFFDFNIREDDGGSGNGASLNLKKKSRKDKRDELVRLLDEE